MKFLTTLSLLVLILSACAPITPNTEFLPSAAPQEYQDFAYQIVWAPDDSMIALTTSTGLYVYDTKTYEPLAAFDRLAGSSAAFSSAYLAAVNRDELFVWSLKDFSLVFNQEADKETYFQNVAISPDNKTLVTAEQKQIRYWSLPTGELLAEIPSANFISDMAFSGKDTLILADSYLGTVQEWDIQSQKKIRTFGVTRPVVHFNLSQDGKLVVVDYGDYGFETWDVDTGKLHHEYADIISAPGWNNLSGDHQMVVVWGYGLGEESGLSVWDLPKHNKLSEFSTPLINGDGWRCGALNSDGTLLAASNNEGYIYFYDIESSEKVGEIYLPYKFTA
jgi:WD40 repeat protein